MPDANHPTDRQTKTSAEPSCPSRRDALRVALAGGVASFMLPAGQAESAQLPAGPCNDEFIPENDYPYFGYDPHGTGEGAAGSS